MCELLVGLPEVDVLGVQRDREVIRVKIQLTEPRRCCPGCGRWGTAKDRDDVELADLPCFDRRARICWSKRRSECPFDDCEINTFTEICPEIAAPKLILTDRAGRWACEQVGRLGRTVSEVARELGCDWKTVNKAVVAYGTALLDDPDRVGPVTAIGLDEILAVRVGVHRRQRWATVIVDVAGAQLLDMVEGRDRHAAASWIRNQTPDWRAGVRWACLDLSGSYRATYNETLPHAVQVADPFHVTRLANQSLDLCRRRVQNDTLGHRGRKDDPLYRARRRLTIGAERLSAAQTDRVLGLLEAGDPHGEVRMAWHTKETLRGFYDQLDEATAAVWIDEFIVDTTDPGMPEEVRRLGRTIRRWRSQLLAWHRCRHSNGPTESMNNLIKRIKRVAFGFRNLEHFRIRALLYAGKPNWDRLATITPADF